MIRRGRTQIRRRIMIAEEWLINEQPEFVNGQNLSKVSAVAK